jgi:hypothetical protein
VGKQVHRFRNRGASTWDRAEHDSMEVSGKDGAICRGRYFPADYCGAKLKLSTCMFAFRLETIICPHAFVVPSGTITVAGASSQPSVGPL